ncbi:AAA family ATPase [Lapillicoccus jejuensis]|uniref:MinD-like ATPase involved in chromosome partitioning or flagellar assembly n=1 Tax=Lapillicoccus jejuensis TaxID=402171 RepID=A0A542E2K5_9MICO|nr:hypothetical protein [Lapillicoccus jejuensis]TQJ09567.1 MinD-like ATPase involved in chromosome partitioning or flagellar assembly [Lapillicoccus jejuensis]
MTGVLVAVGPRWDSRLATAVEAARDLELTRRCPDLADLLAAAAAGLGRVAVVSDDLRGLDLTVVATLRGHGVEVVGAGTPGEESSERRLRQLGVEVVVPADTTSTDLALAVDRALAGAAGSPGSTLLPGPGHPHDPADPPGRPGGGGPSAHPTGHGSDRAVRGGGAGPGDPSPGADDGSPDDPRPEGVGIAPATGRVVVVWGPTGAPGRTSVALNLAAEAAGLGVPTLLVDADTYGASVAQALSLLDEAPGVAAATRAADQGTLDLPVLARLTPQVLPGLRVLTGLPRAERWPELRPAAVERVLQVARLLAALVVVDIGFNLEDDEELSYDTLAPRRNGVALAALAAADEVVAVGAGDPVGLQRLVRGLQSLSAVGTPPPQVVVNRLRASAVGPGPQAEVTAALERFAGVTPVAVVPDDAAAFDAALLTGRVLAEAAPTSPARTALRALAARLARVEAPARRRRARLGR